MECVAIVLLVRSWAVCSGVFASYSWFCSVHHGRCPNFQRWKHCPSKCAMSIWSFTSPLHSVTLCYGDSERPNHLGIWSSTGPLHTMVERNWSASLSFAEWAARLTIKGARKAKQEAQKRKIDCGDDYGAWWLLNRCLCCSVGFYWSPVGNNALFLL